MRNRTSGNFVMTIDPLSAADMEKLQAVKLAIKAVNTYNKNKKRVVLRGRKPITKKIIHNFWTGSAGYRGYDWAGNVIGGLANASKMDVYIYDKR